MLMSFCLIKVSPFKRENTEFHFYANIEEEALKLNFLSSTFLLLAVREAELKKTDLNAN